MTSQELNNLERLLAKRARLPSFRSTVAAPEIPTISFGGGVPDPASLPVAELMEGVRGVLEEDAPAALQYGGGYGYEGLRSLLAVRFSASDGVQLVPDNFLITSGSSQALALVCSTFLDPGDIVLVERTSFPGSLWTIRTNEARMIGMPMDQEGIQVDALEGLLKGLTASDKPLKFLYTIPDFHNPTGATLSLERRRALIQLARRHRLLIVEDIAYRDLRYEGVQPPSLFSLAHGEGVIQMGTFSKVIASGLRLGWAMADSNIISHLVTMRTDMGTSPFLARMVARFMEKDSFQQHLAKVINIYSHKRDTLNDVLKEYCPEEFSWQKPQGGFFLWLDILSGRDVLTLLRNAYQEGVSFVPGANFYPDNPERNKIRLAFSYLSPEDIEEGVRRLRKAVAKG